MRYTFITNNNKEKLSLFLQRSNSFFSCLHTSCKVHRHLETWKPYQFTKKCLFGQINKWHHIPQICNPRCNYQMCPCLQKIYLKSVRNISRAFSRCPKIGSFGWMHFHENHSFANLWDAFPTTRLRHTPYLPPFTLSFPSVCVD